MVLEGVFDFVKWMAQNSAQSQIVQAIMRETGTTEQLDIMFSNLTPEQQADPVVRTAYEAKKIYGGSANDQLVDPLEKFIGGALDSWISAIRGLEGTKPEEAEAKLALMSSKVVEIFAASTAIDIGLGLLPNGAGEASSRNTKELLKWLGFGAVIAAIAHDPVKIGLLRPWQDNLEATFRNRRPDWRDMLKAYQQRSLSPTQITDISQITDEVMNNIETENSSKLDEYGATWGYQQSWINIMKDAETRALTFGNLASMARIGVYDRQLAIFSLWTYGLDRRLMLAGLDAIEKTRDVGLWKGFRSMVEPGYVQGLIDAEDLKTYWTRILVPEEVQAWTLERLTKARNKYLAKEQVQLQGKQRDLTKADWTTAYKDGIITLDEYRVKLTALGYDASEIDIYVKLADLKKVGAPAAATKQLSLSEYELAHRNGLLTTDQVIARVQSEYSAADAEIYRQILALEDLTDEAPLRERDLSVGEITIAYVDGLMTRDRMVELLGNIGYDDEESGYLAGIADIKKGIADAKVAKSATGASVTKERDLTLSQLTNAYTHNVIDEAAYTTDVASLGYDQNETSILVKLAKIKAKLPSETGLKRLPLSDYEKAWKNGLISQDDVLARMKGEYTDYDIGLEKLMLSNGIS